jgi:hypothetical protein
MLYYLVYIILLLTLVAFYRAGLGTCVPLSLPCHDCPPRHPPPSVMPLGQGGRPAAASLLSSTLIYMVAMHGQPDACVIVPGMFVQAVLCAPDIFFVCIVCSVIWMFPKHMSKFSIIFL